MSNTFRRDKLKRMIERGELEGQPAVISGGYYYEGKDWKPAHVFGLTDSDFKINAQRISKNVLKLENEKIESRNIERKNNETTG